MVVTACECLVENYRFARQSIISLVDQLEIQDRLQDCAEDARVAV